MKSASPKKEVRVRLRVSRKPACLVRTAEGLASDLQFVRARWPGRRMPEDVAWALVSAVRSLRRVVEDAGAQPGEDGKALTVRLRRLERSWEESALVPF